MGLIPLVRVRPYLYTVSTMDCIFCKIANKEIPVKIEYEDDDLIVFPDINPRAPIHLLIVPKKHLKDISEMDCALGEKIKKAAFMLAETKKMTGFRLITNVGDSASISHMHVHLLGGITKEREI